MVLILRPTQAGEQPPAQDLACPACADTLAPWGYARARSVRSAHGTPELSLRPRRVRCRGCAVTQVLLPAACLPRRADTVEVIATALLAAVAAATRRLGPAGPAWELITWLTSGRLLAPTARPAETRRLHGTSLSRRRRQHDHERHPRTQSSSPSVSFRASTLSSTTSPSSSLGASANTYSDHCLGATVACQLWVCGRRKQRV